MGQCLSQRYTHARTQSQSEVQLHCTGSRTSHTQLLRFLYTWEWDRTVFGVACACVRVPAALERTGAFGFSPGWFFDGTSEKKS